MKKAAVIFIASFLALLSVFSLTFTIPCYGETPDSWNVNLIGRWGWSFNGYCAAVAVRGDTVYFKNGYYLDIVDFTNPTSPVEIGKIMILIHCGETTTASVALNGNYVYVGNYFDSSVKVIDISDPSTPSQVAVIQGSGSPEETIIKDDYAYIAAGGLKIVDISNPLSPVEVWNDADNTTGLDVDGIYLFDAAGLNGLKIFDISDPTSPIELGVWNTGLNIKDVAVNGNYAYLATRFSGLRVIDISDPTNPVEMGFWDLATVHKVKVKGNYVYDAQMHVIDISDPTSPVSVAFKSIGGSDLNIEGNKIYVADTYQGLRVFDITNPASPEELIYYPTKGYVNDVAVVDDYAFVAAEYGGFHILEVSDPSSPATLAYHDEYSLGVDARMDNEYNYHAYIAGWGIRGMDLLAYPPYYDLSEMGYSESSLYTENITVEEVDDYLHCFVGCIHNGLIWHCAYEWCFGLPLDDPFYPGTSIHETIVDGEYVYFASDDGFLITQMADIENPVGQYSTYDCWGLDINDNYAYTAAYYEGLRILDISNPTSPSEIGHYNTGGRAVDVEVSGSFAYVADMEGGLRVIKISNPTTPVEVGYYDTENNACRVVIADDGKIYLANMNTGLYIFEHSPVAALLTSHKATVEDGQVVLQWKLSEAVDKNDFRMYRKENPNQGYIQLSGTVITENGSSSYELRDREVEAGKRYTYRVDLAEESSETKTLFETEALSIPTSMLTLYQNHPNPFNPSTTIEYYLPERYAVLLDIYDVSGRHIARLEEGVRNSGKHTAEWNGKDRAGRDVSSGVYMYRLKAGKDSIHKKMVLLR